MTLTSHGDIVLPDPAMTDLRTAMALLFGMFVVGCGADTSAEGSDVDEGPSGDAAESADTDSETETAEYALFTPTAEYRREKAWAAQRGVNVVDGRTTVIGKRRGQYRTNAYEDELVVFRSNGSIVRFAGTTRPAQPASPTSGIPDADGNGTRDLGMARPGVYRARGNWTFGLPGHKRAAFRILDGERDSLPAWRDVNGDGWFSAAERAASERRGDRITVIRIHYGFDARGNTIGGTRYAGAWSVGCQNVSYSDLDRFVSAVGGAGASFTYAIVDD